MGEETIIRFKHAGTMRVRFVRVGKPNGLIRKMNKKACGVRQDNPQARNVPETYRTNNRRPDKEK